MSGTPLTFRARSVFASRYNEKIIGLRFFAKKDGNAPADSIFIEFDGMTIDQLIAELKNIRVAKRNPHTGEIITDV